MKMNSFRTMLWARSVFKLLLVMMLALPLQVFAQDHAVKGVVIDENNEPLIGVNITVKNAVVGVGTITDLDGNYTLNVPSTNSTLVFSYVGYIPVEQAVNSRKVIDVTMKEDSKTLEEVVVVGYGVQKKETVVGSVSSVKGEDLLKSPATNLSNSLAGRMSGVVTFQRSGEPGQDGSTIRIRGSNTLGSNEPLIVIDGVAAREGGLERLDPNEVESISVLKDASAAIYGARAANGVILITTKKGTQTKKAQLSYGFNQGWARPTITPKMSNAPQYATLRNELLLNDAMVNPNTGKLPKEVALWKTETEIQKYADGSDPWRYPNTDWYKEVIKPWSPTQNHTVTLEGGGPDLSYFVNFGHKSQEGLYYNTANKYKQSNLRINLDAKINEWVKVGVNMMGRQERRDYPSQGAGDLLAFIGRGRPTDHAFWPNGLPGPAQEYGRNPVVAVTNETGYQKNKRYYVQTNANVEISQPWVEGLVLRSSISYDKKLMQDKKWFQPWYLYTWDQQTMEDDGVTPKLEKSLNYPNHADSKLDMQSEDQTNMVLSAILSYDKSIGDHNFTILAGTEKDKSDNSYFSAMRRYYLSNALHTFKAGGDLEKDNGSGNWNNNWDRARLNYFGRVGYNYKEKYLAEFVWRNDASYMFPKDSRYGFFPGVLLGYRISEENFWKDSALGSFMDYFKVRGSWGQMGNDQVWYGDQLQEYQYQSDYYYEWGYIIDGKDEKGLRLGRLANPNITWEVANNMNIGIEGRMLNSRLNFEVDYFYNKRTRILHQRNASIPTSAGLTLPAENIGKVDNTGFDFKLNWGDNVGRDFFYSATLTGGYSQNKIKFWDEAAGSPEWQRTTGHMMKAKLYYEFDGVFKDWAEINDPNRPNYDGVTSDKDLKPGDMKFKDIDGDGKITPDDRKLYNKTSEPKWNGGLNLFAQYKGFDLTVMLQGAAGAWQKVYFESGEMGNYLERVYDNHWSQDNPITNHPRVHARGQYYWDSGAGGDNTYWMQSTDYIRLKNLEVGYTLPKSILSKTGLISHARVYMNGLNLATLTGCKDIDPETDNGMGRSYPLSKVINFGLSVTF